MLAPVIIPTLNRYIHLRNCVESLSRCNYADKTVLIISVDYPPSDKYVEGWKKIKDYVNTITGFLEVKVFLQKTNLGVVGNWLFCDSYCRNNFKYYIATEDDNVFSPCFLEYMNKMLFVYADDDDILTVCGYNHEKFYNQGKFNFYKSLDSGAWGIGFWTSKENRNQVVLNDNNYYKKILKSSCRSAKIIKIYPMLYDMLYSMLELKEDWGDVKRTVFNIDKKKYQIKPTLSLVRNCGYDGTGAHCGVDDSLLNQTISTSEHFDFGDGLGPWNTEANKRELFLQGLPVDSAERNCKLGYIKRLFYKNTSWFYRFKKILVHIYTEF